jgi:hypothetical protein
MGPKFRLPYGHRGGLAILEGKEPMSLWGGLVYNYHIGIKDQGWG